jgi:hypothetical protein
MTPKVGISCVVRTLDGINGDLRLAFRLRRMLMSLTIFAAAEVCTKCYGEEQEAISHVQLSRKFELPYDAKFYPNTPMLSR